MDIRQQALEAMDRGETARRDKRSGEAKAAFAEAAELCRKIESPVDLVRALTGQTRIERDEGHNDLALKYQQEALAICRSLDDRKTLAHAIRHVGDILQASGRHQEADAYYREMLSLYRSLPDVPPLEMANAIRSVALHREHMGDRKEARLLWQDARKRYLALSELFVSLTNSNENPGVAEADRHLVRLGAG